MVGTGYEDAFFYARGEYQEHLVQQVSQHLDLESRCVRARRPRRREEHMRSRLSTCAVGGYTVRRFGWSI